MTTTAKEGRKSRGDLKDSDTGTLLVVDDNEMNRDMLSRRLARRGHTVLTAEDGSIALEMIEQKPFDVILLDIMMPGIDGMEVLRIVRETHAASDLPIIMATAKDETEDIVSALKHGANDYVTKPLDFQVVLARVQTQLALKRATDALSAAHARMKRDLDAAARVQRSLLPTSDVESDRVRFSWLYRPCDELAGDSLNFFQIDDRHIGVYVIDVSGHGVPSSLLSVAVTRSLSLGSNRSSLIREAGDDPSGYVIVPPVEVANRLNAIFPMESNGSHYFTLLYGILDTETGRFRFVCAGHPGPIRVSAGGAAELYDVPGFPVGIMPDAEFDEGVVDLQPGDRLYLHSDGLNEEFSPDREQFGRKRLVSAFGEAADQTLEESVESVVRQVSEWHGEESFSDDISVLSFELSGA